MSTFDDQYQFDVFDIGEAEDSNLEVELQVICPTEDHATNKTTPPPLPEEEHKPPVHNSFDDDNDNKVSPEEIAPQAPNSVANNAMDGSPPDGDNDCDVTTTQTSAMSVDAGAAGLDDIDYHDEDKDMDIEHDVDSNGHLDGEEQMLCDSEAMPGGQDTSEQGQETGEEQQLFPLDLHTSRNETMFIFIYY